MTAHSACTILHQRDRRCRAWPSFTICTAPLRLLRPNNLGTSRLDTIRAPASAPAGVRSLRQALTIDLSGRLRCAIPAAASVAGYSAEKNLHSGKNSLSDPPASSIDPRSSSLRAEDAARCFAPIAGRVVILTRSHACSVEAGQTPPIVPHLIVVVYKSSALCGREGGGNNFSIRWDRRAPPATGLVLNAHDVAEILSVPLPAIPARIFFRRRLFRLVADGVIEAAASARGRRVKPSYSSPGVSHGETSGLVSFQSWFGVSHS